MATPHTGQSSNVFQAHRAIGYVCNEVPLALQTRGQDNFITTAVGSAYHVYNVGNITPRAILAAPFTFPILL
jgi:hypothetical protein